MTAGAPRDRPTARRRRPCAVRPAERNIHGVPADYHDRFPEIVELVVEIPRGSRNKYEYDERSGAIWLDRVLSSAVYYKPGFEREARVIATLLALPDSTVQALPNPPPVADTVTSPGVA